MTKDQRWYLFPTITVRAKRGWRLPASLSLLGLLGLGTVLGGCVAPGGDHQGPGDRPPALKEDAIIARDGYLLPLRHWQAEGEARGAVLALHGFNDYSKAFEVLAEPVTSLGFDLYAYDQRGFGKTQPAGLWPGEALLIQDALTASQLLRERYPEKPLYLMGESMGAAVSIIALTGEEPAPVNGAVLISPAVWSRKTMPWYQRFALWVGERLMPGLSFSGETADRIGVQPTDDPEVMRQMALDPLVLKSSTVASLSGITDVMDDALEAGSRLSGETLILYGDRDEVIPARPFCALLKRLPVDQAAPWRLALYPEGYHMLTRYTGSEQVENDILAWLEDPAGSLPSGHESGRQEALKHLCD